MSDHLDAAARTRISKRLSRHLRHAPGEIGLQLDPAGWVAVDDLLAALGAHGPAVTREQLSEVVATSDKKRFVLEGHRIRAQQGHSVDVDLGLPVVQPPSVLFHGTAERSLPAIRREGLRPMGRHAVHLSADEDTARRVGTRHGRPVVLRVDAAALHAAGHEFRVSGNGVWLTAAVPARYLGW